MYDEEEDGSQSYCSICAWGNTLFICGDESCKRAFCGMCIQTLCGEDAVQKIEKDEDWGGVFSLHR